MNALALMRVKNTGSMASAANAQLNARRAKPLSGSPISLPGNQAMQRLLKQGALQTKLLVNQPGDAFEQEADRVADTVMRMSAPAATQQSVHQADVTELHRCSCGAAGASGQCEECKTQAMQLQRTSAMPSGAATAPPIVHDVLNSPGRPLDAVTRGFMEPRFGRDFSDVRIHADSRAAESAEAVNALAYTVGKDVVFGRNQYAPDMPSGRRLLAHELVHVSQQAGDNSSGGDRMASRTLLQRTPGVGFTVKKLTRDAGKLDNPSDSGTGQVTWPLSFAVISPLEAEAEVDVTGGASDSCAGVEMGWVQAVHIHWLRLYYDGKKAGDGSSVIDFPMTLPIRDGDPDNSWYSDPSHDSATACGNTITVGINDYPTVFNVEKVIDNAETGAKNFLTGVSRGIHFVTTLIGKSPSGVVPLKFFYWNYLMDIHFRPNFSSPNSEWPFEWKKNVANFGNIHSGKSSTVPLFTDTSDVYNNSLAPRLTQSA